MKTRCGELLIQCNQLRCTQANVTGLANYIKTTQRPISTEILQDSSLNLNILMWTVSSVGSLYITCIRMPLKDPNEGKDQITETRIGRNNANAIAELFLRVYCPS